MKTRFVIDALLVRESTKSVLRLEFRQPISLQKVIDLYPDWEVICVEELL